MLLILGNVHFSPPSNEYASFWCGFIGGVTLVVNSFILAGMLNKLGNFIDSNFDFVYMKDWSTWELRHRYYFAVYLSRFIAKAELARIPFLGLNLVFMHVYFDFLALFIVLPYLISLYFSLETSSVLIVRCISIVFIVHGQHYFSVFIFLAPKIFAVSDRCFITTVLFLVKVFKRFVFGISSE